MSFPDGSARTCQTAWALGPLTPLATTATGALFRTEKDGAPAVLKILTETGAADERGAPVFLSACNGAGAVRLLAHDDGAQLLEYCDGPSLRSLVEQGRDEAAAAILCDCLNKLHGTPLSARDAAALIPLGCRFRALLEQQGGIALLHEGATAARDLLADPAPPVLLHGDMHHDNILHAGARGWLAIDPKGLYGDPCYDYANAFLNPSVLPDLVADAARMARTARLFAASSGLEEKRLLRFAFAHACLSACWSMEDGEDPGLALRCAALLRPLAL